MQLASDLDTSVGCDDRADPLSSLAQQPGLDTRPSFNMRTDEHQTSYDGAISEIYPDPMPIDYAGIEDEPTMPLSHDDILYSLADTEGMNDFWQMPTMVRSPQVLLHSRYQHPHRTANSGSIAPTLPGGGIPLIRVHGCLVIRFLLQCRA